METLESREAYIWQKYLVVSSYVDQFEASKKICRTLEAICKHVIMAPVS